MPTYEGGLQDPREQIVGRVVGFTATPAASITRPANTTPYATGDQVGAGSIEIAQAARRPGGSGVIQFVQVVDSANQATKLDLEVWIFTEAPTQVADNAAFAPDDEDLASLVGVSDPSVPYVGNATAGAGGNCVYHEGNWNRPFQTPEGSMSLHVCLVARNAYTPVSAEVFTVRLGILQD